MAFEGIVFEVGSAIDSDHDPDDFLTVQPDALGDSPRVGGFQLNHPYGFASRPLAAETGSDGRVIQGRACTLLHGNVGNDNHAWLGGDPRVSPSLPKLKRGESCMYGPRGQFIRCHEDGAISMMATDDGTATGRSVVFWVQKDAFIWDAPWGRITFNADGYHLRHRSGVEVDLGAIGGLPPPLDALNSYFKVKAGILQMEAAISADGAVSGISEPIAKATSLLAMLDLIQAALISIVPALNPTATAAVAAASAAVTACGVGLVAAHIEVPSTSKQVT